MNEELRFRAFDDGKMLSMPINSNFGISRFFGILTENAIIMQYSGLKDKNGKEIFRGDILSVCSGYSSVVDFQDGMFVSVYSHPEDGEIIPLIDAIGKDTEVMGNIYEES